MTAMVLELKPKDFMKLKERVCGGGGREGEEIERERLGQVCALGLFAVCARMRKKCRSQCINLSRLMHVLCLASVSCTARVRRLTIAPTNCKKINSTQLFSRIIVQAFKNIPCEFK
jgi:hypothetical protein